jgi:flagellar motor switch protein FliN
MSGVDPNEANGMSQEDIDAALAGSSGGASAQGPAAAGDAVEQAAPQEAPTAGEAIPDTAAAAPSDTPVAAEAEQPAETVVAEPAAAPAEETLGEGILGLTQADIDAALSGAGDAQPAPAAVAAPETVKLDSAGRPFDEMAAMMEAAIAEERTAAPSAPAPAAAAAPLPPPPANAVPLNLPDFATAGPSPANEQGIELLNDVELNVKIELGRAEMLIEEVIKLGEGSVVELDKLAGDPVDVLVNDRLVARGEVIVLNENFCVRVSEIIAGIPEEEAA